MKRGLYFKLAVQGIKKNRRLYYPYLLTCILMVMMQYLFQHLSCDPIMRSMRGGTNLMVILGLGRFVMAVFSLIFMLYTSSFITKRRYKEFGLYNILGMDKRGITRVVARETLIAAVVSLVIGLLVGIALSKFSELVLCNIVGEDVSFSFNIPPKAVLYTVGMFAAIFLIVFAKTLAGLTKARPLQLMKNSQAGEKPPKANFVFALLGLALMAFAYYMAVTITDPLSAMTYFFIAVIMVIIGTYLLFIAGSVAICKLLQKNKKYYYNKKHFVSVSSMAFRMKRNGAGLASICILITMVLVMISSSSSLYMGSEDMLRRTCPQENNIGVSFFGVNHYNDDLIPAVRQQFEDSAADAGMTMTNIKDYTYVMLVAKDMGGSYEVLTDHLNNHFSDYDDLRMIYFVTDDEYNKLMGTDHQIGPGEALCSTFRCSFDRPVCDLNGLNLEITGSETAFPPFSFSYSSGVPTITFVVSDLGELLPLNDYLNEDGNPIASTYYQMIYDIAGEHTPQEAFDLGMEQTGDMRNAGSSMQDSINNIHFNNYDYNRSDYYSLYGGLFFIGILLSIVFMLAAVLIIYYKQVSEGYEDHDRFEIMQKVGMTKQDIKKTINSQMLTVFFAPVVFAGLHMGFAFPMIWRMLKIFNLVNFKLVLLTTVITYLILVVIYAIVYKLTSNVYYNIVSGRKSERE